MNHLPSLAAASHGRTTSWRRALITGASSGIGEAFAAQLAASGVDLVLVGRDREALQRVANEARAHGVDVQTFALDLSQDDGLATAVRCIDEADPMIDLLVNSAGIGPYGSFAELPRSDVRDTMRVNNDALVQLCHAALGRMVPVDRGCIINVSSAASRSPLPNLALYVATKSFVNMFGESLAQELSTTNVSCTSVLAGYTRTRFFDRNGLDPQVSADKWASSAQVAQQSLEAARSRKPAIITGPSHKALRELSYKYPNLVDSPPGRALRGLIRRLRPR
jgi:uncharacterized protein